MEPEKKVHVSLDVESIVNDLELEECIDVANKLDETVLKILLDRIRTPEGGYATDEEIQEFLNTKLFELLKAVYKRGDL